MTIVAIIATGYVRRVLAGRRHAIVTAATIAEDLCVVDREHWREHCRRMAVLTNIGCLHVRGVLAGGKRAVVTANTIVGSGRVIECRRQPARRRVTVIAGVAAGDM